MRLDIQRTQRDTRVLATQFEHAHQIAEAAAVKLTVIALELLAQRRHGRTGIAFLDGIGQAMDSLADLDFGRRPMTSCAQQRNHQHDQ